MNSLDIPGYEDVMGIGQGANCWVYSARRRRGSQLVAIKMLRRECEHNIAVVKRFRREAQLGRSLDHPHIVKTYKDGTVFDLGSRPPYWFAMELVEGNVLSHWVKDRGRQAFSEVEICDIVIPICKALDYAHNQSPPIVHRDIKPSNIAITANGRVKLMDFGIAQQVGDERLTRPLSVLATPEYMPPERMNSSAGDARSDLYSLGVVMYELATGRLPFNRGPDETDLQLAQMHCNDPPTPPKVLRGDLSEPLNDIILRLLAKDPAERFESAAALQQELALHRQQLSGNDESKPVKPTRRTKRPREPAQGRRAGRDRPAAALRTETRGGRAGWVVALALLAIVFAVGLLATVAVIAFGIESPDLDKARDWFMRTIASVGTNDDPPEPNPGNSNKNDNVQEKPQSNPVAEHLLTLLDGGGSGDSVASAADELSQWVRQTLSTTDSGATVTSEDGISEQDAAAIARLLTDRAVAALRRDDLGQGSADSAVEVRLSKVRKLYPAVSFLYAWRRATAPPEEHSGLREDMWKLEEELFLALVEVLPSEPLLVDVYSCVMRTSDSQDAGCVYLFPAYCLTEREISNENYGSDATGAGLEPVRNVGVDEAREFARRNHLSLPTWHMWRIATFGTGELGIGWEPGLARHTRTRSVVHTSRLEFGGHTATFHHPTGNWAEWVELDIPRECLEGEGIQLVEPGLSVEETHHFCGLGIGREETVDSPIWLNWGRPKGAASIGFRCALKLADPIELPPGTKCDDIEPAPLDLTPE